MDRKRVFVSVIALVAVVLWWWLRKTETFEEGDERDPALKAPTQNRRLAVETTERAPKNKRELELVSKVRYLADEFIRVLNLRYPSDPRTTRLVSQWNGDVRIYERAAATWGFGHMWINPNVSENWVDARLRSKILHELAHSSGRGHDAEWRQTWAFFLRVATKELGWQCAIRPPACKKYNLCWRDQCPRCQWLAS